MRRALELLEDGMRRTAVLWLVLCLCAAACNDEPGECSSHSDCAAGEVCRFGWDRCAPRCNADGTCADPLFCDICASSSCRTCADCVPACIER